ncbi:hypothetical protein GP486_000333, partial [Trichoglossum hirsutum]
MERSSRRGESPRTVAASQSKETPQHTTYTGTATSAQIAQSSASTYDMANDNKYTELIFKGILELLRGLNLFQENRSIFLVYAHDKADSKVARNLIRWLSYLRSNLLSDRSSGYDPAIPSTPEDENFHRDILPSQLCLLPPEGSVHSFENVILCGSQLLGEYIRSDCYDGASDMPYTQAIQHAYQKTLETCSPAIIHKAIREVVDRYSGKEGKGFHHVLTELAFLHIRAGKESHGIIPFLLNGSYEDCFPEWVKPTRIRVELDPMGGEGGLHGKFFRLLSLLLNDTERKRDIQAIQDCYNECIRKLRDSHTPLEESEVLKIAHNEYLEIQRKLLDDRERTLKDKDAILRADDFYRILINIINPQVTLETLQSTLKSNVSPRLSIQRISGQLLPMGQCYVNLAVVEHPKLHQENQESHDGAEKEPEKPQDRFHRLPSFEAVNANQQVLVSLQDLFEPRKLSDGSTRAPKRILIWGRAGVGKTTLSKKIVYEFMQDGVGKMWSGQFNWVLRVPLRKLKLKSVDSLTDFIYHEYFHSESKDHAFAKTLNEHIQGPDKFKTLFILDGLDEIRGWEADESKGSFLKNLLNQPTVIITSRPIGVDLTTIDPMDLELETIGFSQENVWTYLEHKDIMQSEEAVADIKQFIKSNPFVQEMVNVPIQLDAFCYSWDEIKQMRQVHNTSTVTTLYQAMIHKLWRKDILRLEKQDHGIALTAEIVNALRHPRRLEQAIRPENDFLGALAFDGLKENQIEFNNSEIDNIIRQLEAYGMQLPLTLESNLTKLSFLHTDDHDLAGNQRSYHFMHLTFQEFFAAQWLVKQLTTGQSWVKDCVRQHKYNPRYEIVWQFMAGLLPGDGALDSFFGWLGQEPHDLLGIQHQYLIMRCLNESQDRLKPERRNTLELDLCEWLEFELENTYSSSLSSQVAFPETLLLQRLKEKSKQAGIFRILNQRPVLFAEAIKSLIDLLKDTDSYVRGRAAGALGQQSNLPIQAIEGLIGRLKDTDSHVRVRAAQALGRQSSLPGEATKGLVDLLKDTEKDVQDQAALALGRQPDLPTEAIKSLTDLLKDTERYVRRQAAQTLGRQSNLPIEAIKSLVDLLKDREWYVRRQAALALGRQSNLPVPAIEDLVGLLKDTEAD